MGQVLGVLGRIPYVSDCNGFPEILRSDPVTRKQFLRRYPRLDGPAFAAAGIMVIAAFFVLFGYALAVES